MIIAIMVGLAALGYVVLVAWAVGFVSGALVAFMLAYRAGNANATRGVDAAIRYADLVAKRGQTRTPGPWTEQ